MKNMYDVRFCSCGRVHFIDRQKLLQMCDDQKKEVIHICNNCGAAFIRGLDECPDGKTWYAMDLMDTEITDLAKIGWIIASKGERVLMETGGNATEQCCGTFFDRKTPEPQGVSDGTWEVKCKTVDIKATVGLIGDKEKRTAMRVALQ